MSTEAQKAYMKTWYLKHKDRVLRWVSAYKAANPDKVKTGAQRHREANKERLSARAARYYQENSLAIRERMAKNRRENLSEHRERDRVRAIVNNPNRRAHLIGLPGNLSFPQWEAIKTAYGNRCAYCGSKSGKLTIDHVIPISKGGATVAENIVPACAFCNGSKGNREALVLPAVRLMI